MEIRINYNKRYNLYIVILGLILAILLFSKKYNKFYSENKSSNLISSLAINSESLPFRKAEKIIYNVLLFGVKIGQSELLFVGKKELNNQEVEQIIFSTTANNLKDLENIYVDSKTFLPLRIERSVKLLGKKMSIVEDYNIKNKTVTISKTVSGKTTKQTIKSDEPLQNIISLTFQLRKSAIFQTGEVINVDLPLIKFQMKVTDIVDFKTRDKKFKAYLLESSPKKYRIWFDQSPKRIPLRIDGAVAFGNTAMVMKEFIPGNTD